MRNLTQAHVDGDKSFLPNISRLSTPSIPDKHHLLITTPSAVYAWDSRAVRRIFSSSRHAIKCATLSKDGRQVLAVADAQIVVLHDCKRQRQESWGLSGFDDRTRTLHYAANSRSLFLTTDMAGAVQCYSVQNSKMSRPGQEHPFTPGVVAVSPDSQLLLSASAGPPLTYLQNLQNARPAHKLETTASDTPVRTAAFHPDRPSMFLLGFQDGTLAFYDASKAVRETVMDKSYTLDHQRRIVREVAIFKRLHRTTNRSSLDSDRTTFSRHLSMVDSGIGDLGVGVLAAAFVPERLSLAVSVGGDGRCRVVAFDVEKVIPQTWQIQGHPACLSICDSAQGTARRDEKSRNELSPASFTIAVGTANGSVLLYDPLGKLLHHLALDSLGIIGLEWIHDEAPPAMKNPDILPRKLKQSATKTTSTQSFQSQRRNAPDDELRHPVAKTRRQPPTVSIGTVRRLSQRLKESLVTRLDTTATETPPEISTSRVRTLSPARSSKVAHVQVLRSPLAAPRRRVNSATFLDSIPLVTTSTRAQPGDKDDDDDNSSLDSQPIELDPDLTLSYLMTPEEDQVEGRVRGMQKRPYLSTQDVMQTAKAGLHGAITKDKIDRLVQTPRTSTRKRRAKQRRVKARSQTRNAASNSSSLQCPNEDAKEAFTTRMNRTAAADLRRGSREISTTIATRRHDPTKADSGNDNSGWLISTSASATGKGAKTSHGKPKKIQVRSTSASLHALRKADIGNPHLSHVQTVYYDAPTYPPTKYRGRLLDALRLKRLLSNVKVIPETSVSDARPIASDRPAWQTPAPIPTKELLENAATTMQAVPPNTAATMQFKPTAPERHQPAPDSVDYFSHRSQTKAQKKARKHVPGYFPFSNSDELPSLEQSSSLLDGKVFSPTSAEIRQLCPRHSSLSPLRRNTSKCVGKEASVPRSTEFRAGDTGCKKDQIDQMVPLKEPVLRKTRFHEAQMDGLADAISTLLGRKAENAVESDLLSLSADEDSTTGTSGNTRGESPTNHVLASGHRSGNWCACCKNLGAEVKLLQRDMLALKRLAFLVEEKVDVGGL